MQEIKQEKSPIKQKILLYLQKKGISPYEFYKNSGVTRGILAQNNGISEDNIARFLAYCTDVRPEWLLTGVGAMLKTNGANDSIVSDNCKYNEESFEPSLVTNPKLVHPKNHIIKSDSPTDGIPLITIEAIAGFPTIDEPGRAIADCDRYVVPELADKGAQFLIRVSGSSMYPKYSSGDILACRKITERLFFQWGKIYVIDSSQGIIVKRVFPDNDHLDMIKLVSDNKDNYPPFDIPKSDIRSLSIVVGAIRFE